MIIPNWTVRFLLKRLHELSEGYKCLDASRLWLEYWILHSLEMLGEIEFLGSWPKPAAETSWIFFWKEAKHKQSLVNNSVRCKDNCQSFLRVWDRCSSLRIVEVSLQPWMRTCRWDWRDLEPRNSQPPWPRWSCRRKEGRTVSIYSTLLYFRCST